MHPYSYLWSNGDLTEDIDSLQVGNYQVTVTDTNNCTDTAIQNIVVHDAPNVIATSTNTTCYGYNDGQINVNITGGTPPIIQNWGGVNTTSLVAGSYAYSISDSNDCIVTDTVNVYEPPGFSTNIIKEDVICNGDSNGMAIVNFQIDNYPNSFGTESLLDYCILNILIHST